MALECVVAYAAKFYRASASATKNGVKYVINESEGLFTNHTQLGRRLREGVHHAREAVKVKMQKLSDKMESLVASAEIKFDAKRSQAVENLKADKDFMEILEKFQKRRAEFFAGNLPEYVAQNPLLMGYDMSKLNNAEFIQLLIETMGVGTTKAAQIFSGNVKILEQIEKRFGPEFVKAMKNTKSGCIPTRTVEEAQQAISKAFPGQNIMVTDQLGVASIGETYLVKRPDGTNAVCKMIKKGVDKEQLELEEKLMERLAKEFTDSPEELSKIQGQLRTLYRDWAKELDFSTEKLNNELLAKGAKRFSVARITDIAQDGSCIIMNKANGIKMDKLIDILKDYRANPTEFATKYSKEIAENPWLANPEKVAKELSTTLLKTFDEQFMFVKKGGTTVMHGDPHTGNYFITANDKGKLIPEFIDTGSCITRTSAQVKDDISFFSNYFVGNSRGVAEYFVKQTKYSGPDKKEITQSIAKEIQETIFGKKQNIKNFADVQENINAILEKYGLQMAPENATAMKAQMQFFSGVSEAGRLSGQSLDIFGIMKDIPQASWSMIKTGSNPFSAIKDALKFAFYNQKQAVGTAYQFTIKDVDKVLKSDGTLLAIG